MQGARNVVLPRYRWAPLASVEAVVVVGDMDFDDGSASRSDEEHVLQSFSFFLIARLDRKARERLVIPVCSPSPEATHFRDPSSSSSPLRAAAS